MRLVLVCLFILSLSFSYKQQLVWSDEFNYEGLPDSTKWDYEIGFNRNKEEQYYQDGILKNSYVKDGVLTLEAHYEKIINPQYDSHLKERWPNIPFANYSSVSINTHNKFDWKYGYVEVRAKLPKGKGIWPAIWTLGSNRNSKKQTKWPNCGEIDIMEFVGKVPNTIWSTIHYAIKDKKKSSGKNITFKNYETLHKDFHLYVIKWNEKEIKWYLDGKEYHTFKIKKAQQADYNPFKNPHYLLLNIAVGGSWGGEVDTTIFPQKFIIDYVRVYQ